MSYTQSYVGNPDSRVDGALGKVILMVPKHGPRRAPGVCGFLQEVTHTWDLGALENSYGVVGAVTLKCVLCRHSYFISFH